MNNHDDENKIIPMEDLNNGNDAEDEPEGAELSEEETGGSDGFSFDKLVAGFWYIMFILMGIGFVLFITYEFGVRHGAGTARFTDDAIKSAIEEEFSPSEAAYLIRKIEAYKCDMLNYSIYGSAKIAIHTAYNPVDGTDVDTDGTDVVIEFDYSYYDNRWHVEDYSWPNKPTCACECESCTCIG